MGDLQDRRAEKSGADRINKGQLLRNVSRSSRRQAKQEHAAEQPAEPASGMHQWLVGASRLRTSDACQRLAQLVVRQVFWLKTHVLVSTDSCMRRKETT